MEYPDANRLAILTYVDKVLNGEVELDSQRLTQLLSRPQTSGRPPLPG